MEIIESFDASPNTNLLDVLGNSGYSLQSAIADIIDNSITAKAKNIYVDMQYNGKNSIIKIVDDGCGMNLEKLKQASIIAFRDMLEVRDQDDLGRFSTGINSSSASMCKHLIIQSKSKKDYENHCISINYNNMKKNQSWICNVVKIEENYLIGDTGTVIIWNDLKELATANTAKEFYDKIAVVEKHLSHVFCDYINSSVNIYINKNKITGWDPFYERNIKTTKIYDEIIPYHNSKIGVKVYVLPPYNNLSVDERVYMKGKGLGEQQGFYIYRKNRLIKEGGWLDLEGLSISNKYDYARIRIDIDTSLDPYFKPNFLKNELYIPDDLKDLLKNIAISARNESRKSFNYMRSPNIIRSIKQNNKISVWKQKESNDGILLSINEEHPIIKSLSSSISETNRRRLFKLISTSLPIGEMLRSGVSNKQLVYPNIEVEINEMYKQLKNDGFTEDVILKKMISCEPFCSSQELITALIDFFYNKGVKLK